MSFPVICINLDKRTDRWKQFSSQPGLQGFPVKRVSAVDGRKLSLIDDTRISPETRLRIFKKSRRSHGEINTPGAIGCSLSHYNIWTNHLNTPFTMICEDDTKIPKGFLNAVEKWIPNIPQSADIWQLSWRTFTKQKEGTPIQGPWQSPPPFWGTNCYLVRRTSIPKLTNEFFPIESHLDNYFQTLMKLGKLQIVIHTKIATGTFTGGTDIQLYRCSLCNLPDNLNDQSLVAVNKYVYYGIFTYAVLVTLYAAVGRKKKL